jgi:hypothetical protein
MLFVRMLIIILQRLQRSIQTKELAYLSSLRHHHSHPTQMSTAPVSEVEGSKGASSKSYFGILPSTSHLVPWHQQQFFLANQSGRSKKNKSRRYKRKKPTSNHGYEGLLSLMQGMLRNMANMDKTCKPPPRVKQVWVRKDETIHPMRGNERTYQKKVFMHRIWFLILSH